MAKLSLAARKDIKDNEPKLQANLKAIEATTGIAFEVDIDLLVFSPLADEKGYENRVGAVVYAWYLEALAKNIAYFCQDAVQKESFISTFGSAKKISFEIYDESVGGYARTRNDNGTLMMGVRKSTFCSNIDRMGDDLSKACSADGDLSVATRKNIKDAEATRAKNIERINKAVGLEFQVQQDWVALSKVAATRGFTDRIGDVINWYLAGLAGNLEPLCKDDMSKEAVAEACTKKTISFVLAPAGTPGYGACTFVDGVLTATLPTDNFVSNVEYLGGDIEKQL